MQHKASEKGWPQEIVWQYLNRFEKCFHTPTFKCLKSRLDIQLLAQHCADALSYANSMQVFHKQPCKGPSASKKEDAPQHKALLLFPDANGIMSCYASNISRYDPKSASVYHAAVSQTACSDLSRLVVKTALLVIHAYQMDNQAADLRINVVGCLSCLSCWARTWSR
eukprot:1176904-Prorocentrum_minimum.AAC.8